MDYSKGCLCCKPHSLFLNEAGVARHNVLRHVDWPGWEQQPGRSCGNVGASESPLQLTADAVVSVRVVALSLWRIMCTHKVVRHWAYLYGGSRLTMSQGQCWAHVDICWQRAAPPTRNIHALLTLPLHGSRLLIRRVWEHLLISQLATISDGHSPIHHLGSWLVAHS